ncbi:CLUMA_CG008500, isoform A [Clunio marinus]|uniref:Dolichol-phosphate mannosyltransferase subunit 3 n=1 Tax=Clunio marinus TaxID=568069 RepID=A0A1J1I7S6_9DIPT|nr:CLUMA_CG008500, isoform A [Clunio marinus]
MTKLNELLIGLTIFFGIYGAITTRQIKHEVFEYFFFEIQILPIIMIIALGIYAVTTVLYRTLTFNDCKEAALELQTEIQEAKQDLKRKGFKFDE